MAVDLVTGGTGSFGHAYVRRLLDEGRRVRVFSRDEEKQRRMAMDFPDAEYVIGDVRDRDSVRQAMRGVGRVFHAAALKQVPQGEAHPGEYNRTNVQGTEIVCREAAEVGARLVYLSTDKAVLPVSVMGASKMMGEAVAVTFGFNVVRYGNVVGSRGSVIPLFRSQIAKGQPITITNPDMTRFLITLDEAVGLIDKAMSARMDGTVYVRKSPAATVAQIASVLAPGWPQKVIGTRRGEKPHEDLVSITERAVDRGWYFAVTRNDFGGVPFTSMDAPRLTDEELADLLAQAPRDDY